MLFLIWNRVDIITKLGNSLTFFKKRDDFISVWMIRAEPFIMHNCEIVEDNGENLFVILHAFLCQVDFHGDEAHSSDAAAVLIAADPTDVVEALEALIQTARTFMSNQYS